MHVCNRHVRLLGFCFASRQKVQSSQLERVASSTRSYHQNHLSVSERALMGDEHGIESFFTHQISAC